MKVRPAFRQKWGMATKLFGRTVHMFHCHYCGKILYRQSLFANLEGLYYDKRHEMTIDHKIPLSKGGSNKLENLVPACKGCNLEKADMDYESFMFIKKA